MSNAFVRFGMWCIAAACGAVGFACSGEAELPCAQASADCTPLYPPTFDDVFTRTLQPTCTGQIEGGCHSASGNKGGLIFEDIDTSYDLLVGKRDGRARVDPNDINCSILVARIEHRGQFVMPPGRPLSAQERCSIIQWVANGAQR